MVGDYNAAVLGRNLMTTIISQPLAFASYSFVCLSILIEG